MIAGIFLAFSFFVSFWFLIGFCVIVAAFIVAAISRRWFGSFGENKATVIIVLVCFVIGLVSMSVREGVYRKNLTDEGVYYISAKVVSTTEYENDLYRLKIDSVKLCDASTKDVVLKLNEAGFIWAKTDFEIGDKICFVGYYAPVLHNNISNISPNNAYEIKVYSSVETVGNFKTVFEQYKSLAWNGLYGNMSESAAGISFAMLCGDSSKVVQGTKDNYRVAGVGHILAVSGLHVGFFVLVLSFLLDILRLNKKIKFAIISVLLIAFCWFCGFSYSVLRASIMCIVLLYSGVRGKQYDGLSALCFATIIVLGFVDPYQLFSASFLLSFFAVLAIFCLYRWFDSNFSKIYPKKLSSALAVGIATSIGILPWQVYYFGYFSTLGVLLNLIVIPLATVVFAFGFVFLPLTILFPVLGVLLKLPNYLIFGIDRVCVFVNKIPFATVKAIISPITIVAWFVTIVLCSDFVFIPRKAKFWARFCAPLVTLVLFGLNIGGVF